MCVQQPSTSAMQQPTSDQPQQQRNRDKQSSTTNAQQTTEQPRTIQHAYPTRQNSQSVSDVRAPVTYDDFIFKLRPVLECLAGSSEDIEYLFRSETSDETTVRVVRNLTLMCKEISWLWSHIDNLCIPFDL